MRIHAVAKKLRLFMLLALFHSTAIAQSNNCVWIL